MCLLVTLVSIYFIYFYFNNTNIDYLVISDNIMAKNINYSDYLKNEVEKNKKIKEFNPYFINDSIILLYQDIINNRTIRIDNKDYFIKRSLRESDFVVISVGMEELSNNYNKYDMKDNYNYFNKMYLDIEKLINEIKKYAQDKIIFLGYYNPTNYYDSKVDEFFYDMDIKLNRLMVNNNITYIDLYELVKGNSYKEKNSVYLNNLAHKRIANILEFYIE